MKIDNHDMVHIERITERLVNGAKYFAGAQDTHTLNQLQSLLAEVRHFALSVNRSRFPDEDQAEYEECVKDSMNRWAKIFIN
jgi:hypothetical protein